MQPMSLDKADEITDGLKLVNHVVGDFYVELIFNHDHQLEPVEPIGPKILAEAGSIRDTLIVYAEILGNQFADVSGNVLVCGLALEGDAACSWLISNAMHI